MKIFCLSDCLTQISVWSHLDTLGVQVLDNLPLLLGDDAGLAEVGQAGEPLLHLHVNTAQGLDESHHQISGDCSPHQPPSAHITIRQGEGGALISLTSRHDPAGRWR